jgi:hypothetical protein
LFFFLTCLGSPPYLCTADFRLTPYITILPEKPTGPQLAKKFPAFYEIRKFTAAFITARHLSYSKPE